MTPNSPMPVRLSLGTWVSLLVAMLTVMATGAYFVASTKLHQTDNQRHLNPTDGAGWGASADFETRDEAREARADAVKAMDKSHEKLKGDLIRVLGTKVKYVPRRRRIPTSTLPVVPGR